jgi:hypothetical protein
MTGPTPQMVVSGVPYRVVEVDGREPVELVDFAGVVGFVLDGATGRLEVLGEGAAHEEAVRFHEKAGEGGKDVRVWHIHRADDAGFTAQVV